MKVAITKDSGNNQIFQHFGKTKEFVIFEIEDGKVVSERIVETLGNGHSELGDFLRKNGVNSVICGGIGSGAVDLLKGYSIEVFSGNEGDIYETVKKFMSGDIVKNDEASCHHHDKDHDCTNHQCRH